MAVQSSNQRERRFMTSIRQGCGIVAVLLAIAGPPLAVLRLCSWTQRDTTELIDPFFAAARKGDARTVRAMLAQGVDVNAKTEYGATALSFAADKGHLDVVKVLLRYNADPNIKDTFY